MPELLKNTYTLIAAIVAVCTLGSFGGVSLYIINTGFANQTDLIKRVAFLESVSLSRAERDKYHTNEINRLKDNIYYLNGKTDK